MTTSPELPEPLVLMYHGIDPGDGRYARLKPGARAYVLAQSDFEGHLDALERAGRQVVGPDALERLEADAPLLSGQVLLTFDDGSLSDYDTVLPLLSDRGMRAAFFITTNFVGRPGHVDWAQVREMAEAGMPIGAHGASHRMLPDLSPDEARGELHDAKARIEDAIGAPVRTLSFPGGRYSGVTIGLARAAGYETAFTSSPSPPERRSGLLLVGRVPVRAAWNAESFERLLSKQTPTLRRMRHTERLRRIAQTCLGHHLYSFLHNAVWRRKDQG